MAIGHVTQTGNISIPKSWREELGIELNSSVIIERKGSKIVIEPLKPKNLKDSFKKIDEEIRQKGITFTREETLDNDLYD